MKSKIFIFLIIISINTALVYSQNAVEQTAEVFIVDSYVSETLPHTFNLYFFTDDSVKTSVLIDFKYEYQISNSPATDHKIEIEFTKLVFDSVTVPYQIFTTDSNGKIKKSEILELELPYNAASIQAETSGLFNMCLGGVLFLLPSPGVVFENGNSNLSLSLEVPLFSFYSNGFNYPSSYISTEYSHIFGERNRNVFKIGYKQIYTNSVLEFVSPGINVFTNFSGFNGLIPEATLGIFKIADTFTFYGRYKYYIPFDGADQNFHEISFGLYAHFFSLNL